jgi:hypothetical protein
MALETATHIDDLVITNPDGLDDLSQGDNHLRMLKDVLKRDLPLDAPATTLGMNILKSATSTAVRTLIEAGSISPLSPYRNVVINGNAKIDSRWGDAGSGLGAIAFPAGGWICDRWCADGSASTVTSSLTAGVRGINKYVVGFTSTLRVFTALTAESTAHLINKDVTFSCNLGKSVTGNVTIKVAIPAIADSFNTLTTVYTNTVSCTSTSIGTKLAGNFNLTSATAKGVFIEFSMTLEGSSEFTFKEVQLELGTLTASQVVYEIVDPAIEAARCRYFLRSFSGKDGATGFACGRQGTTTQSRVWASIEDMYKVPIVSFKGSIIADIAGVTPAATLGTQTNSKNSICFYVTHAANGAAGQGMGLDIPSGSGNRIDVLAEVFSETDG